MTKIKKVAAAALVVLTAGCGGNSTPTASSTPAANTSSLKIDGEVFKGTMANARVSLYKPTADGKGRDLLERTTTDDNGHYSATVNGYSGVMIMEASVVPGTTMYDEATEKTITPTADFVMRASFSAEAGKTNTVQINPFTDLATAMALAKVGGLSASNVAQANKDLTETLTFDPRASKPEFDAATKAPRNTAAVMLAAVSGMAKSGELGCEAGEQETKVACVTKALSEKGLENAGVKLSLQNFTNAVAFKAGRPAIIIGNSSGTAPSTASAVEQTKDFLGMLRSNAKALDAIDLSLQDEFQAVAKDMTGPIALIAKDSIEALNLARLGVQFTNDVIENNVTNANGLTTSNSSGSCTLYTSAYGARATCLTVSGVTVQLQASGLNTFTMTTRQPASDIFRVATLTTTRAGDTTGSVTAVKLTGDLSSTDTSSTYEVNLSAALSTLDGLDKLAVSGSIDLINDDKSIKRIELTAGSYMQAKLVNNSYSAQDGSQEMLLKLRASAATSVITGDLELSTFKLDASRTSYIPTSVSFAGSVQRNSVSFFEGTLTGEALNHASFKSNEPHSTANVQKMRVGFTGKVAIPNRPALNVNLSVVNNDTGNSATSTATLGGQYSQGAIVINLDGETSAPSNILTLTSGGVKLVIDKSKASYPLTKNGELVGEYSPSNSRINYIDNSYEQF